MTTSTGRAAKPVIVTVVLAALAIAGCSAGPTAQPAVQRLPQPTTVQQIGTLLHLTGVTDCADGSGSAVGVTDTGIGWKAGTKYAFDTFANSAVRDQWKKTVTSFGIVPVWQGSDWVAYKSTNQAAKGC